MVGRHHHFGSGVDSRLIAGEVILPEGVLRKFHILVVPACLCCAVTGKVLDTGGNALRTVQIRPLEAPDHGSCHLSVQVGVLPGGLHAPPPPGIPAQIRHRGKGHMDAVGSTLPGRHCRPLLHQLRGEGGCQAQGAGKGGTVAVNHIQHKEHGDVVGLGSHTGILNFPQFVRPPDTQGTPCQLQSPAGDVVLLQGTGEGRVLCIICPLVLHQLVHLFLQGHILQQLSQCFFFHGMAPFLRFPWRSPYAASRSFPEWGTSHPPAPGD